MAMGNALLKMCAIAVPRILLLPIVWHLAAMVKSNMTKCAAITVNALLQIRVNAKRDIRACVVNEHQQL